jgi:hypothetical protein
MNAYPVRYSVDKPARFTRLQLLIRVLAFVVLGMLGLSLGLLFMAAYVALPIFAAARLSGRDAASYLEEDGPRVVRALRWFAAVFAWLGLATETLPLRSPEETVHLEVERSGQPTSSSALWRLLIGLPSALLLGLLAFVGGFVWLWAALIVLMSERVGDGTFRFLAGLQRWSIRLLAYQASLVDPYPPFSFDSSESPTLPAARIVP